MTRQVDKYLPQASAIDYTNTDEVCGYQVLLCKIYEREGGFGYPAITSSAILEIIRQGKIWLGKVKDMIDGILSGSRSDDDPTLEAIPDLLGAYDFMFRICNDRSCLSYVREVKLKTVGKWVKGDRSITETDVTLLLLSEVDRDIHTLEDRYTNFALSVMEKWIDELVRFGRFRNGALSESLRKLAYLLNSNLFAYLGSREQPKIKTQWAQRYTLTDEQINALDTKTLRSYIQFANSLARFNRQTPEQQDELYVHLFSKLLSRPDLHYFYRTALKIDLAKYPAA